MSQPQFVIVRVILLAVCLAVLPSARAEEHVAVVKNDRVNLRARPDLNAEVVTQVNAADRLAVVSIQENWVEVVPPSHVDVWAHRDFVKDGTSTVKSLNLRAGPGINYSIVGTLSRGDAVEVRGQFGEWIKVSPNRATLWISRELVDIVTPVMAQETPAAPITESAPEAALASSTPAPIESVNLPLPQPADLPLSEPAAQAVQAPIAKTPPADLRLVPLEGQGRLVRREGELKPAPLLFGRPSSFRLVKREGVQLVTLCYVRGNTAQLNSLLNQSLIVYGREYWVQGIRQPVLVLERIERRPTSLRP